MTDSEMLLSRTEAAQVMGVTPRTVNRYAAAGYLKPTYVRVRGQLVPRYDRTEVESLNRHRERAESSTPDPVCS
ncbi:MAG TPA: hypothetical protein VLG91_10880 [Streptomyces sp.]|nr:hypothetical protein [Streptomyces sp.]